MMLLTGHVTMTGTILDKKTKAGGSSSGQGMKKNRNALNAIKRDGSMRIDIEE